MTGPSASTPAPEPASSPDGGAQGTWWQRHHRQFWLVLALFVAATAPIWGGLLLLWAFSPSSPFPQSP